MNALVDGGSWAGRGRTVHAGFAIVVLLFIIMIFLHPQGVLLIAAGLAIGAILLNYRLNPIADRLPWQFMIIGVSLLDVVNVKWFIQVDLGGAATADDLVSYLLQMAGFLAELAASVVVVLRHAPHDAGGVIDAALIGCGIAAPGWEFVLRPRLVADGASASAQIMVLVKILVLFAIIGALVRISRTADEARAAVCYFFAALMSTVLGVVLSVLLVDTAAPYIVICWMLGYVSLAAAALHPSSAAFTQPGTRHHDALSTGHIVRLGLVLLLIPVVGGVPQLLGQEPDGMLLSLGQIMTIPLVLTRIVQLMAQRAHDQRNLTYQANHDELTGLANRRHLFALVSVCAEQLVAGKMPGLAMLFFDLDDFKSINDQLGHDAGDHVLRVVGERLTTSLRGDDVVGRIGGDEFLAVCPGVGRSDAEMLRRRAEQAVAEPLSWRGVDLHIGVTVGVAVGVAFEETSADALVAAADQDMYARKRKCESTQARDDVYVRSR